MLTFFENQFPWLGYMTDLGGDILVIILVLAALMWSFLLERIMYMSVIYPKQVAEAKRLWMARSDRSSWYAQVFRNFLIHRCGSNLQRNIGLAKTLVKLCPLLGLLGTVLGMLEVFDAVAITGSNNPRSTAAGVSKAIITTMAGMVVAISGLPLISYLSRKAMDERTALADGLPLADKKISS